MEFIKKNPPFFLKLIISIALFLALGSLYKLVNMHNVGSDGTFLRTTIDTAFPFVVGWVWFYYLYFLVVPLSLTLTKSGKEFASALTAFAFVAFSTLVIFTLFPTKMDRPVAGNDCLSSQMLAFIQSVDEPFNCFPSQHVAYSWLGALIAFRFNPIVGVFFGSAAILISLSTLFVKQHWFWDLPSGIAISALAYWIFFVKFGRVKMERINGNTDS
jgi:membrane-associated phospholipid phosphatase